MFKNKKKWQIFHEAKIAIENLLNICPWIYTHKPSIVKKMNDCEFSITIYVPDNFTFQKVEEFLLENIKNDTDA